MAIEWVYANLEQLGGSPDKVAFIGQGLGAAAALLHAKVFKPARVISSSGSLNMRFPFAQEIRVKLHLQKRKLL